MSNEVVKPTQTIVLRGLLKNVSNVQDKALLIEREVGMDAVYTMISMGYGTRRIADSLNLSDFEFEYIVKRTPDHRRRLISAKTTRLAESSIEVLKNTFSTATSLFKEESAAAKHHRSIVDSTMKTLGGGEEKGMGTGVIVNNQFIVRGKDDIPDTPKELDEIIEGDYAVTEPNN